MPERKRRRRATVLGVPVLIVAVLALVALWRVGTPRSGEPGSAGTIGLNPDRHASLERVEVRQLTSDRTFWVSAPDDEPIFIVADQPVRLEPGAQVSISGRVEAVPTDETAAREWGVGEATVRAVRERGIYVRASRITPAR